MAQGERLQRCRDLFASVPGVPGLGQRYPPQNVVIRAAAKLRPAGNSFPEVVYQRPLGESKEGIR